jgi:HEAT repeat protein
LNTRRIILVVLAVLLVLGIGNFVINSYQTRSQLAMVASKDTAQQDEGVRRLMARGVLFDALQGSAPPETRIAAIKTLTRMAEDGKNPDAFKQLLQMLKDPDTESVEAKTHPVRDAAKDAVAKVGVKYSDILFDAAKDSDNNIRDQSREALKKIGKPLENEMAKRLGDSALRAAMGDMLSSIGPETVPLIAPYLKPPLLKLDAKPDDLEKAKIELIEMLGKFTVREAAEPILPFKDDPDPNVRRSAVVALANIGDPIGAPVLIQALNDPAADASARAAAAGALGAIATPEANAALMKALTDFDVSVATAAAAGLHRADDRAASSIAQALANPDATVRRRAAEATGGLRTTALAQKALTDPDAEVREQGVAALGDIFSRSNGIRADLNILATSNDPAEREKAFDSLQTRGAILEVLHPGTPSSAKANALAVLSARSAAQKDDAKKKPFDDLAKKLNDQASQTAETALPPLADGTSPAALAPLLKALSDPDGRVAQDAVVQLGRLGSAPVKPLVALLSSADDTVAYYASQALIAIQRPAVDDLLSVAQEGKPGARWAAVTLGEIGDPRAIPALENLSKSSDPDTAFVAGRALAKVQPGAGSA